MPMIHGKGLIKLVGQHFSGPGRLDRKILSEIGGGTVDNLLGIQHQVGRGPMVLVSESCFLG